MSKDSSSSLRSASRSNMKPNQFDLESNENDLDNLFPQFPFPPPRTPLNSIADPSQLRDSHLGNGVRGKAHSEPNSAQTTPLRRISNVFTPGTRHTGAKGATLSSRTSKGTPAINSEPSVQVPHFELPEDPSFWKDHNVQVLIRVRPLNNTEKVSEGYGRCLRQETAQTLVWLGHPETRFTFDHVACETISQEKLFRVAGLPMVDNCMSGYNSCMFAYGQTGSGKTYTMMGDIGEMSGKLSEQCGITPRIFEYLFTRIREEEDKRKNERLKYSCKCSFLEIYIEQITDLLEPSSTNLLLREDLKKGVYVENLTEVSVSSVEGILRILLQGAANRKMAATHMNTESSRSHSVVTCNIESCWEKDSMKHFRFGRLNLVDLAGSERQKSSGAEGDRLKEAANINKSLSTLGEVDELQGELGKHVNFNQTAFDSVETMSTGADKANRTSHDPPAGGESKNKEVEDTDGASILQHNHMTRQQVENLKNKEVEDTDGASILQHKDILEQLIEVRSLMETMEQEQVQLIEELELTREENQSLSKQMCACERSGIQHMHIPDSHESRGSLFETPDGNGDLCMVALQAKLEKMSKDLEEARLLNSQYI